MIFIKIRKNRLGDSKLNLIRMLYLGEEKHLSSIKTSKLNISLLFNDFPNKFIIYTIDDVNKIAKLIIKLS